MRLWLSSLSLALLAPLAWADNPPRFRSEAAASAGPALLDPYGMAAGVALLGVAVYWLCRRAGACRLPVASTAELHLVRKCRLSSKTVLYVIRHRDRELLLAEHEHGVTPLRDESAP